MQEIFLTKNNWVKFLLIIGFFVAINLTIRQGFAHETSEIAETPLTLDFNNAPLETYEAISKLSGDQKSIQSRTKGIWPRQRDGRAYNAGQNRISIARDDEYLRVKTNNIPDHTLYTNNPNCAKEQNYSFKIPLKPTFLEKPISINSSMQSLGVAINGVVIAGPFDSQNKIAPYNRQIDQCAAHSDKEGMYHYHFAPLCLTNANGEKIALDTKSHIGWSFDGVRIFGLADRYKHLPELDQCNGHQHDGEYHYHATVDYPFFMGCYKAKPVWSNQGQKVRRSASCPSSLTRVKKGKGKRPEFKKAAKALGKSIRAIKKAIGPPPPPDDLTEAGKILGVDASKLEELLFPRGR